MGGVIGVSGIVAGNEHSFSLGCQKALDFVALLSGS